MANYNLLKSPAEDYFRGQAKRFGITLPNHRQSVPNKRTQANVPSYISRQSGSRLESDIMPHGDWYRPSQRSIQRQKDTIAEYDWNKHIDSLYKKQYQSNRQKIDAQDDSEGMLSDAEKEKQTQLEEDKLFEDFKKTDIYKNSVGSDIGGINELGKDSFQFTLWKIGQRIGLFSNQSSDIGIESTKGKIALAQTDQAKADAWSKRERLKRDLKSKEDQWNYLKANPKAQVKGDAWKDTYLLGKEILSTYDQLQDKDLNELADAYKATWMKDHTSMWEGFQAAMTKTFAVTNDMFDGTGRSKEQMARDWLDNYNKQLSNRFEKAHQGMSLDQKEIEAKQFKAKRQKDLKDYKETLDDQMRRASKWKKFWNVSKHAENLANIHANDDLLTPDYWLWNLPQQMGSSWSSDTGNIGNLIKTVGTVGSFVLGASGHAGAGFALYNAANAAALPFDLQGAEDENYAEIAQRWTQNYQQNLNKYEAQEAFGKAQGISASYKDLQKQSVKFAMQNGMSKKDAEARYDLSTQQGKEKVLSDYLMGVTKSNDPRLSKAKLGTTKGLEQQFMVDNVRTMGTEVVQNFISYMAPGNCISNIYRQAVYGFPTTKLGAKLATSKLGRLVIGTDYALAGLNGAVESKFAQAGQYINSLTSAAGKTGAKIGSTTMDVLGGGVLGHYVGAGVGAAAGEVAMGVKGLAKEVMPQALKDAGIMASEAIAKKAEALATMVGAKTIKRKLLKAAVKNPNTVATLKMLNKYGINTVRKSIIDRASEGNEEIVQQLNANAAEEFAKTYGYGSADLLSLAFQDMAHSKEVSNFYFGMWGLTESELYNDMEMLSNWRGGFAMGGMHPMVAMNIYHAANDIKNTVQVKDAIMHSALLNREEGKMNRASNAVISDQISKGRYNQLTTEIQQLREADLKRERPRFGEQYWNDLQSNVERISALVNNKQIEQQYRLKGINKGTEQYNVAIADRANIEQQLTANRKAQQEAEVRLQQIYGQYGYQNQVEQAVNRQEQSRDPMLTAINAATAKTKAIESYVNRKVEEYKKSLDTAALPQEEVEKSVAKYKESIKDEANEYGERFVENSQKEEHARHINNFQRNSEAHNRMKALLTLKAKMNSIDDIFKFAHDKLGLKTVRPDAKLLSANIDKQIARAKQSLAKAYKNFNEKSTDEQTLQFLNNFSESVGFNDNEIQELEQARAMYTANESLLNSTLSIHTEGITRDDNGNLEYNPDELRYQRKQAELKQKLGDKYKSEEHTRAAAKDGSKSKLNDRITKIIDANKQNENIDWMLSDIYSGDAVTKLTEDYQNDMLKAAEEDIKDIDSQAKQAVDPTETQQKHVATTEELQKHAEEYKRRRDKAREHYRKKRKARRNKARVSFLLGFDELAMQSFDGLMENAKVGFYKFEQLYNDIKTILQEETGQDGGPSVLALAKAMYIRHYLTSTRKEKENMNTPMDVQSYGAQVATHASQDTSFDGYRKALKRQQNRAIIHCFHTTIAYDDNNTLHVFENIDEIDRLEYQSHYPEIEENVNISDKQQILGYLADNTDRFGNQDYSDIIDTIFSQQNKEELLQGFAHYLASIDTTYFNSQSIRDGETIRELAQAIMLGNDDSFADTLLDNPNGLENAKRYIKSVRDRMLNGGQYRVLDTDIPIYGYDDKGRAIQSQADIVLVDNDGQLLVIDVRSSFKPDLKTRMLGNQKSNGRAKETMIQQEQRQLQRLNQVLYDTFGSNVEGTYVMPFYYDRTVRRIVAEPVFKVEMLDFNKPVTPYYNKSNEDISNEVVRPLQDKVNNLTSDLQSVYDSINEAGGEHKTVPSYDIFKEGSNKDELLLQMRDLYSAIESIQSLKEDAQMRLNQLLQPKQHENTVPEFYPEDVFDHVIVDEQYQAGLDTVHEICKKLDALLSSITNLNITTADERAQVNELIYSIYDAQTALDQFYGSDQFKVGDTLPEQKLITAAINKLVNNRMMYGDASNKALQMWQIQFASNIGNPSFTYFNKIKSFLATFDGEFMNSLVGNKSLQRFWSTVINNQLKFLADNAKNIQKTNTALDNALTDTIYDAEDFIREYNQRFPVDPNTDDMLDINSAQSINMIDDQWRELYSDTTKHFPAFRAKLDPHYFSIALDPHLIYPDASGKSGNAELVWRNNEVQLKLTDSKGKTIFMTFDQGNDAGPRGVDPVYFARKKAADSVFVQKVKYMLDFMKTHPGYHIGMKLSRSKGSIKNGSELQPVSKFLFAGTLNQHDLYNITCDAGNRIGFLKATQNVNTGDVTKMVYGGPELSSLISGFDLEYVKRTAITQSGNIVYFYDTGQTEKAVDNRCIGTPLIQPKFTSGRGGQANKIADLIWYKCYQGLNEYQGYSIDDLLKQVLYIKADNKVLNEKYNSIEGLVTLDPANKRVIIGNVIYPTQNPSVDYANIYNALCNMYMTKDAAFVQQNMQQYIQSSHNSVLAKLNAQYTSDPNLDKVELPNGLTFTREDFTHDGKGTTGLGYMLRNGYLMSYAAKLDPPTVYVDNVELVQDHPDESAQQVSKTVAKQDVQQQQKQAEDTFMALFYEQDLSEFDGQKEKPSFANAVDEWVRKTTGITPQWVESEKLSDVAYKKNSAVLAKCTDAVIQMSNSVPYTIGFHEGFHRALELLVEPSIREQMYSAYRKTHPEATTERDIAEGLADLFVDYMLGEKDANTIKKQGWIKRNIKKVANRLSILWHYRNNAKTVLTLFNDIKSGKYADKQVSKEQQNRFKKLFGEDLHYEINGRKFDHIGSAAEKEHMARAIGYIIVKSAKDATDIYDAVHNSSELPIKYIPMRVINNLIGEPGSVKPILNGQYMSMDSVTPTQQAFREVFYAELNDNGDVVFPNFSAISKEVQKYLTEIMDAYDGKYDHDDDSETSDQEENDYGKSIERYDKSAFEFNKLDSVSKPVKMFFATIPYYKFNDNGKLTLDTSKNIYGIPTFMPIKQVFNVIVSKLHDVKTPLDLLNRLQELSTQNPMYMAIYQKYNDLYNSIYTFNDDNQLEKIDFDKEAFMIQIFTAIKGHEHNFIIGRSIRNKNGGVEVKISDANFDRDARMYPKLWNSFLSSGQSGLLQRSVGQNGQLLLSTKYNTKNTQVDMPTTVARNAFRFISQFFSDLQSQILNDSASEFKINGRIRSAASNSDIEVLKDDICKEFNMLGINFTKEMLDHMLSTKYNGVGREALKKWIVSTGVSNINSFIDAVGKVVQTNGYTTQKAIDEVFKTGFVSELGNWAGAYMKITTDKMSNGMDGTKLYNESQNNSISNTTENLNSHDKNNMVVRTILQSSYNIMNNNGVNMGSIVAKQLQNGEDFNISIYTPIGFKSDNRGDNGSKYSNLAEAEDYINKFAMLQNGYCIFPTLADKGTYMVLGGINIPGMEFGQSDNGAYTVSGAPKMVFLDSIHYYLQPNQSVLNQFIDYAYTEREAILDCREQLGLPVDNPKGLPVLNDEDKIMNYHIGKKGKQPGGIQFKSLTTLRVYEDGQIKRYEISKMSPDEQLKTLNEQFFDKSREEQEQIMSLTLQEQYENEVDKAVSLGIVSKDEKLGYLGLNNINLNQSQIDAVERTLYAQMYKDLTEKGITPNTQNLQRTAHSMAITAILQDATNRAIISSEESLRLYIGNPGFFKNVEDIQKRIGGLVSTGDDDVTSLPNYDGSDGELYRCAEISDYEVASNADIMSELQEKMRDGELREIYGNHYGFKDVDSLKIEAVRARLVEDFGEDAVKKIEDRALKFYQAYLKDKSIKQDGINVADGASYITADMCKRMLRARGALKNDVAKAINILESSNKYSWMDQKDAYKLIYDKVNLVTTKYTAYGFRDHTTNGKKVSNLSVPYYNKFALFPIFDCIATGKLKNVYDKMKENKVDNLLMTSAVKVGLQGHSEFDGDTISKPLNVYTQRLSALRRQLNTDPEEGDVVAAGTQMIKVCLSSLRLDRTYGDMTGEQLRDKLMGSINKLSKLGVDKFKDRFYSNGIIDQKKLSEYLIEQLGTRNANKNLIDALTYNPQTGSMNAPIASTSDASWMESMLISAANKDIIDIMTPGSSFIQRSVFAIEGKNGEGGIQGQEVYNGKRLQMINEEGSMDAVISIDYFQDILPKNLSYNEARQWLLDHNIIGEKATSNTIGYRIPTQAQSSIHALRFVDVVPAVKSTVILPTEFTKITGSDFDIDHLYLARYNVNKDGKYEFDPESAEGLQNSIIESILTVLKDKKSLNILYKSIDNDTELVTSIADEIPEYGNTKSVAYNFGTLHEQVTRKNDYITGKTGIGPFALNVTNHILTTLYGVKFKESSFTNITGITGFDQILDEDNNQISSWLSAFINAHVDIVKDPYISKLNVNGFTYNMINLLARNGKGKQGLYFLCQPIIREMAKADIDAKSQFTRDPKIFRSAFEMRDKRLAEIFPSVTGKAIDDQYIKDATEPNKSKGEPARRAEIVNSVLNNMDMLQKIAKNPDLVYAQTEDGEKARAFQVNCYIAWKCLEKYSNALNSLVQYTKIDTRKQGKNFLEMKAYLRGYENLTNPETDQLFDMDSINNLIHGTWIEQKTRDAIQEPMRVMSGQSFQGTPQFMEQLINLSDDFKYKTNDRESDLLRNAKTMKKISQAASSQIKARYAVRLAKSLGIDVKGLFDGNATIFDRLNSIQACIQRDAYGLGRLKDNYLLSHLAPYIQDQDVFVNGKLTNKPKFISVINSMDESKMSADMFIESWEELINDPQANVRRFANDLILYAMLTSGDTKGFNKIAKYIPMSWLKARHDESTVPFSDYIKEQLEAPEIDHDLIAQNNYMDSDLVSRATFKDYYYAFNAQYSPAVIISKDSHEHDALYISVRNDGAVYSDPTSYTLYKKVGEAMINGSKRAVYALLPKRGWSDRDGLNIYEAGDINLNINGIPMSQEVIKNQLSKLMDYLSQMKPNITDEQRNNWMSWFNQMYYNANSEYPTISQAVEQQSTQSVSNINLDGKGPSGQTIYISKQLFYKDQPQQHPNVQYVFTDNAQAYAKAQGLSMQGFANQNPVLNVSSGATGTNQACIRTGSDGKITPNAFGLVVKVNQQDASGKWLSKDGCFQDNQGDIMAFKSWVNHMLARIDNSKPIVFPSAIALGKAALPREAAEWLGLQLLSRFNIKSTVQENTRAGYTGYGLSVEGVVDDNYANTLIKEEQQKQALAQINLTKEDIEEAERIRKHCKGGK